MPRETPKNHYRRSYDFIDTKLYVIATEGYNTEYKYFTAFKQKYNDKFDERNLHVEILRRPEQQHGKSSPKSTEQMLQEFIEDNQDYDFQADRDELWLIIDTDTWEKQTIQELVEKCQTNKLYHLGISNPCFEIWLILHLADLTEDVTTYCITDKQKTNAPNIKKCIETLETNNLNCSIKNCIEATKINKRSKACKQLHNLINNKHHLSSMNELIDYIPQAISKAKALDECDLNHICSTVYRLLEQF